MLSAHRQPSAYYEERKAYVQKEHDPLPLTERWKDNRPTDIIADQDTRPERGRAMGYVLPFGYNEIGGLADRYTSSQSKAEREAESHIIEDTAFTVRRNGYYTKAQFLELCYWKTPRSQRLCAANDEQFIGHVTALALGEASERLRIEVLTLLGGVSWPTASVLLHFGHTQEYPILDVRALWSLSIPAPKGEYKFSFWWDYVHICRELKKSAALRCVS